MAFALWFSYHCVSVQCCMKTQRCVSTTWFTLVLRFRHAARAFRAPGGGTDGLPLHAKLHFFLAEKFEFKIETKFENQFLLVTPSYLATYRSKSP